MSLKKINQLFNFEKGVLQSSKCIEGEYDFITAATDWKTHNEYSHDSEALIFAAAASGSLGRTHYVKGKFISSDLCFILTPKEPEKLPVDLKFYHIIFNLYKNEIVAATKAGTSKEAIGLKVFGEYELPYFDLSIQQKVKAEFGKAEALKKELFDEYTYQLTQLENLNQAILQEAVQGKLVAQDPKDEPASELLKRIKVEKAKSGKKEKPLPPIKPEEIPFEIPENWVWCRLGEMSINRDGERKPISQAERNGRKKIYDYYGASGVIDKIDGYTHEGELLLIGEDGANLVTRSTPIAFFAKGQFWVNNHAHVLDTVDRITLDYLCAYINSIDLKPFVTGGFQPKLSQGNLNIIPVPLPPLSEQKRIVAEIEKQFAKTKQLKEHIIANQQATEQLLKALLHQAFEVN
ncbi:MAG: restriction endonuclease subunit S [Paludibacteraceae bacterium]|nr:restriction endonuclease subunit S [Paludibacteraceae bacterium]